MTPPFNRRELLKLAGVGLFATGGPAAEASAQSEESELVETDLVRVTVPTTAGGNQILVGELARDGDPYARNINAALRDETGNTQTRRRCLASIGMETPLRCAAVWRRRPARSTRRSL